jgi:hypothetical protein
MGALLPPRVGGRGDQLRSKTPTWWPSAITWPVIAASRALRSALSGRVIGWSRANSWK